MLSRKATVERRGLQLGAWGTNEYVETEYILVEIPCITIAGDAARGFFDSAPKAGAPLRMTADAVNEDTVEAAQRSS
jgi:hypothetical protein